MTESRIIYITGMKPKPPPAQHREALVRVLDDALARRDPALTGWLDGGTGRFTLVSWTSLLYPGGRDIALDLPGIGRLLERPEPEPADVREIRHWRRRLVRAWHLLGDSYPLLTRVVATSALKATLGEVHRYLENRDGVGERIRALLRLPLLDAWQAGARVLLIGHSLGSVIAYDTLWQLSREAGCGGRIGLLLTLGSPIATRFIRLQLKGTGRDGPERYPANIDRWLNVSARGELVALHPRIEPFFRDMVASGLLESLSDRQILNHFRGAAGLDVHKSYGYLHHPVVAETVADWIAGAG